MRSSRCAHLCRRRLGIRELFLERIPSTAVAWPRRRSRRRLLVGQLLPGVDWLLEVRASGSASRRCAAGRSAKPSRGCASTSRDSDGLGAIFPPMIYTRHRAAVPRRADDDPEMRWALKQLDDLMIEEDDTLRLQPCFSPVWDTALAHDRAGRRRAADRLARDRRGRATGCWTRKCARRGDWSADRAEASSRPAGSSSTATRFYPDTDDTAMVLMALAPTGRPHRRDQQSPAAVERADPAGCSRMQNRDGGWAAFDRDINNADPDARCRSPTTTRCSTRAARHHRPRAGSARRTTATASATRRSIAAIAFIRAHAGSRRLLVRPLGRQLHLRHLAGAARASRAIGFDMTTADGPPRRRLAEERAATPTAAGARRCAQLRRPDARRAGPHDRRRKPPGPCWA